MVLNDTKVSFLLLFLLSHNSMNQRALGLLYVIKLLVMSIWLPNLLCPACIGCIKRKGTVVGPSLSSLPNITWLRARISIWSSMFREAVLQLWGMIADQLNATSLLQPFFNSLVLFPPSQESLWPHVDEKLTKAECIGRRRRTKVHRTGSSLPLTFMVPTTILATNATAPHAILLFGSPASFYFWRVRSSYILPALCFTPGSLLVSLNCNLEYCKLQMELCRTMGH